MFYFYFIIFLILAAPQGLPFIFIFFLIQDIYLLRRYQRFQLSLFCTFLGKSWDFLVISWDHEHIVRNYRKSRELTAASCDHCEYKEHRSEQLASRVEEIGFRHRRCLYEILRTVDPSRTLALTNASTKGEASLLLNYWKFGWGLPRDATDTRLAAFSWMTH